MKRTPFRFAVFFWSCISPVALYAAGPCNSSTLNGTYLYRITGTVYSGGSGVHVSAPAGDFAAVGLLRLNNGSGTGVESSSNAGVLGQRTFTIAYTAHDDCTGTTDLSYCPDNCLGALPDLNNLVMARDGSYAWFVNTVQNTSLTGEFHKVPGGACTALSGSYNQISSGAGLNGRGNAQTIASSARFASVGAGATGGATGDIAAFGGLIIPRQYSTPAAALNADCTGDLGGSSINPAKIYAAGDGSEAVVLNWFPGTIVSGWLRRQ